MQVVIFSSPSRIEMLEALKEELKGFKIKVIDDPKTFGKRLFWQRWYYARLYCLASKEDNYLILPDDVTNLDLNRIKEIFIEKKNKLFTCNVTNDGRVKCWGGDYFDCGGLTNRATMSKLKVTQPTEQFFKNNISSGVGHQLTIQLRKMGAELITPAYSLCSHGDHDSVMHYEERKRIPLIAKRPMKVIVVTAMHGRHETVRYCLKKSATVERLIVYSTADDRRFLRDIKAHKIQAPNNPLSTKWNTGIQQLRNIDFDIAIIMGSDDYFDVKFIDFVKKNIKGFDGLGCLDAYYEQGKDKYYYAGYKGIREGEPMGAGRCYTREFLERIDFNLYPLKKDKSLDGMAWDVIKKHNGNIGTFSLKDNNLMMCDVKDGTGMTPLSKIPNLEKVNMKMKIVVGMATFKGREQAVEIAINSLSSQVDEIILYDNEVNPDIADNGKFYGLTMQKEPCYYFTCDDDLIYPPDYISKMIEAIERHGCIITHHGRILQGLDLSYYKGHKAIRCLKNSSYTGVVDIPGTGVTGFRTDYFNPNRLHLSKDKKMSDCIFALEASKQQKKIMSIPHSKDWIKQIPIDNDTSICRTMVENETRQIQLSNIIYNAKNN